MGTVRAAAAAGAPADRRRVVVSLRTRRGRDRSGPLRHRAHPRHVRRHDRLRRAIAPAVPRHEQRLAGKRSRCSPASSATSDRRPAPVPFARTRRVRRRDDRRVPRAARRGPVHRRGSARVRHALGQRLGADRRREPLRERARTASCASATPEIRADGLFSLGYPREDGGEEINARIRVARRDLDSLRHAFGIDEYPGVRAAVGRVPPDGRVRASGRVRRDDDQRGRRLRRAVSAGDVAAAVRRHRRPARQPEPRQGHRHRSPAPPSSAGTRPTRSTPPGAAFRWSGSRSWRFRARRCRASPSSPRPAAGPSSRRATTSGIASTICSSAKKASAWSTARWRCAAAELSGSIDAASPRMALTGTGRIALTPQADAELTFRFHDTLARSATCGCSCRGCRRSPPPSPAARSASWASWPTSNHLVDRRHGGLVSSMRLLDYSGEERRRRSASRSTGSRSKIEELAAGRRRHAAARVGHDRPQRRTHRAEGRRRRQPRHPPGLLPRRPRRRDGPS